MFHQGKPFNGSAAPISPMLTLEQGSLLVSIARRSVDTFVADGRPSRLETGSEMDGFLRVHRGAFVTLSTLKGDLRGCIGFPYALARLFSAT